MAAINTIGTNALKEKEWYKEKIVEIMDKIHDEQSLKRIYNLSEYLYINK